MTLVDLFIIMAPVSLFFLVRNIVKFKGGGVVHRHLGTRNGDTALFHRLAEHLQHLPAELRQLIKKKHPVMR